MKQTSDQIPTPYHSFRNSMIKRSIAVVLLLVFAACTAHAKPQNELQPTEAIQQSNTHWQLLLITLISLLTIIVYQYKNRFSEKSKNK